MKLLIIDDSPLDAELSLMALRRGGVALESETASDEAELRSALRRFSPDVVLCDFSFPTFDGLSAQRIVHDIYPEVPLIFVSGTISEEGAAMALQGGAVDYVMKSSLVRLPSAVRRAADAARLAAASAWSAHLHAARLERLWAIVNDPALHGPKFFSAMLHEAAASIGPPLVFRGVLGRIEGDDVVPVAVSDDPEESPHFGHLQVGRRNPIRGTIIPHVGRSAGWADLASVPDLAAPLAALRWRAVISQQFYADGLRYSMTFASTEPKPSDFSKEDFAYLDVIAAALANQLQVNSLEESLRDEEERSRHHAQRLEALWAIANDAGLGDVDKWLAMLAQAAASIWPEHGYRGILWRVAGEDIVVEAVAESPGHALTVPAIAIGAALPREGSVVGQVLAAGGGTRSWSNLESSLYSSTRLIDLGVRSFVITTFTAGSTTWALSFASALETPKALGPLENAYIEVVASFFANNVQQRMQFERLEYQEAHDALTGLLNRSQFAAQARSKARTRSRFAIIAIDINDFHEINDSYGHTIGDALLLEVGNALQTCSFSDELVGRIGADIFGIYIDDPVSPQYVRERARDFANVFVRSFSTGDRERKKFIARSASLGIACAPEDGLSFETIFSRADAALGAAKERGHGETVCYEVGMEHDGPRRAALRNEIMAAIAGDQFTLFYQPHVEVKTGLVTGCEALIRWNHPDRGLVLPGEFIPFAEHAGIIQAIDAWVMRHAFAAAHELGALRPGFRLYFNLSGRQTGDPKLVRAFINAARIGVELGNIGVEITETDAMRDVEATRRVFRALRRLNVRIAIDDFGTGYSSLSSLKRLPVDIVKIDRSFISGVTDDDHDAAIAETIVSIANRFGFESLGEGAEKPDQVDWLRDHGCRYVQGYAVCYPLPLAAFKAWLADHEGLPKAS